MNSTNLLAMNTDLLVPLIIATLFFALVNVGFYVYISRELKKADKDVKTALGRYTWLRYFTLGWMHAKELKIVDVMAFWSFILALTGIGFFLTALTLMATIP
jgi:hypothetical protein